MWPTLGDFNGQPQVDMADYWLFLTIMIVTFSIKISKNWCFSDCAEGSTNTMLCFQTQYKAITCQHSSSQSFVADYR